VLGKHLPENTVVGMNAWVVHRNKAVFGEDAEVWRPERWIEADAEHKKLMESCLLTVRHPNQFGKPLSLTHKSQFGAGHRTCLGKHISLLEIYKLVPTLLMQYDVRKPPPLQHRPSSLTVYV
jgi:cytochrome P450